MDLKFQTVCCDNVRVVVVVVVVVVVFYLCLVVKQRRDVPGGMLY